MSDHPTDVDMEDMDKTESTSQTVTKSEETEALLLMKERLSAYVCCG